MKTSPFVIEDTDPSPKRLWFKWRYINVWFTITIKITDYLLNSSNGLGTGRKTNCRNRGEYAICIIGLGGMDAPERWSTQFRQHSLKGT